MKFTSDDTSLAWLLRFAHQLAERPLLVIATYRSDEVLPSLATLLAALDRARAATEVALPALAAGDVAAMMAALLGTTRPLQADFITAIVELTEGNPFFVEEVLRSLVAAGDLAYMDGRWERVPHSGVPIPRSIQVAVQQRSAQLSPAAREVLVAAAVVGQRCEFDLVQRLTGLAEPVLLALIKELIAAQLVVEESAERFAFRHALTQQAVVSTLLARERRALHQQVAEIIEQQAAGTNARVGDLSYHYYAAANWAPALLYARRAGEQAAALQVPGAAVEHFTRALDAAQHLPAPPAAALYRARGQAREQLGDFAGAQTDYAAALARARASADRPAEWQSLLNLGWLWTERDYQQAGVYLQAALALARELADPALLGPTLNRVGNWYGHSDPLAARRAHEEARALFQAAGDRRSEAITLDLLGVNSYMSGNVLAGVAYYEQAVRLFRAVDDRQGLAASMMALAARGASYLTLTLVWPYVETTACVREAEEALLLARQINWRAGEAEALAYLAHIQGPHGLFAPALARGQAGLALADELQHRQWQISAHVALGGVAYDLADLPAAEQHFTATLRLAREINSEFMIQLGASWLALVLVARRQGGAARGLLATLPPRAPGLDHLGLRYVEYARAWLAIAEGDAAGALAGADALIAAAPHVDYWGAGASPHLWWLRGAALAALDQPEEAEAALRAADGVAGILGLAPLRWRITARLGHLYRACDRRAAASAAFADAWQIVAALAAALPDATARAALLTAAGTQLPPRRPPTPRGAAKQAFAGLTERERSIAARVARGQSNRAIAADLTVSERTIEKHVENILGKLGFQSRAQIAAWAVAIGLADAAT